MTLYLASGKDPTTDSGNWVIIVEATSKYQALVGIRRRLHLSSHSHLLQDSYHFQELPPDKGGLLYCDCTGAPQ